MPGWLRWWLTATLFLVWSAALLIVIPAAMSAAAKAGEPSFTDEERIRLMELMPKGRFNAAGTEYLNCENRRWVHYTPTHDAYWLASERNCWQ